MNCFYVFERVLDEPVKCKCGYETTVVFVLANDSFQAETKFEMGKGLCANCLVDLIKERGYRVCTFSHLKPAPRLKPKRKRKRKP